MSNQITNKEALVGKRLIAFTLIGSNQENCVDKAFVAAHYLKRRHFSRLLRLGVK